MKRVLKELKPFNMARLNELRKLTKERYCGFDGLNKSFWDELECILRCNPKSNEWELKEGEAIRGKIWCQRIGEFYHKHTVHRYEYMYVQDCGEVVAEHGPHKEPIFGGRQYKKIKEWYIFPDGTMVLCKKDDTHSLDNCYGAPIYVISLKIGSKAI